MHLITLISKKSIIVGHSNNILKVCKSIINLLSSSKNKYEEFFKRFEEYKDQTSKINDEYTLYLHTDTFYKYPKCYSSFGCTSNYCKTFGCGEECNYVYDENTIDYEKLDWNLILNSSENWITEYKKPNLVEIIQNPDNKLLDIDEIKEILKIN